MVPNCVLFLLLCLACAARRNPCENGGSCLNHGSWYSCACQHGYTGSICDVDIKEQFASLSRNYTCKDLLALIPRQSLELNIEDEHCYLLQFIYKQMPEMDIRPGGTTDSEDCSRLYDLIYEYALYCHIGP